MGKDLEAPFVDSKPTPGSLYRARADEVSPSRPVFTGDVFTGLPLPGKTGNTKNRSVIVIQHPCSMRADGVNLSWQVLVAVVSNRRPLDEPDWQGNFNLFPLPDLIPASTSASRNQAGDFDSLHVVSPEALGAATRIASLSPYGVNLLLQRWVHYSSRVIVPTLEFQNSTGASYEEADLIEEWCEEFEGAEVLAATASCIDWLREDVDGSTSQEMLKDTQALSTIRREMRQHLKTLRTKSG